MQRLRLKADGRIVELRDGQEFPLAPAMPGLAVAMPGLAVATPGPVSSTCDGVPGTTPLPAVRDLRRRARLTQLEFAARLGVPVRYETMERGTSRGGLCRLRGQAIIVVDEKLGPRERVGKADVVFPSLAGVRLADLRRALGADDR